MNRKAYSGMLMSSRWRYYAAQPCVQPTLLRYAPQRGRRWPLDSQRPRSDLPRQDSHGMVICRAKTARRCQSAGGGSSIRPAGASGHDSGGCGDPDTPRDSSAAPRPQNDRSREDCALQPAKVSARGSGAAESGPDARRARRPDRSIAGGYVRIRTAAARQRRWSAMGGALSSVPHMVGRYQQITLGSVISCSENLIPSRHNPEFLIPPKGIESSR